jgi:transposase
MGGGHTDDLARETTVLRLLLEQANAQKETIAQERDQARQERDAALEARDLLAAKCADLDSQVQHLLRQLFGRRSEKLSNHPVLPFELDRPEPEPAPPPQVMEAPDEESATIERPRRPRRVRRLRPDVPKVRVELPLPEAERTCQGCGKPMQPFGEEITQRFDYQPASLVVRELVRPKYSCPCCQSGVRIAELPPAVIEKGVAEPGLLAQVAVAKYADHLPLERQQQIFARHGLELPKSTMCDWIRDVADLLAPIVAELRRDVLGSHVIHSDDTPVTVLDRAACGGSRKGYLWVYIGDRGDVVYDFTRTRGRDGPLAFLHSYHGFLLADAYSGYDEVFASGDVTEVACWAHVRRYFFEAAEAGNEIAVRVLHVIRALYRVEQEAGELGLDADRRQALRQEKSKPLLLAAEHWLRAEAVRALPRSPLGKAFGYCLKLWPALLRYLDDGRLAIDNNKAEREMRRVAVGRKNWEFAGSDEGGKRAAVLYSLIATCRMNDVEPWAYLKDVLARVSSHPASRIAELTPRGWKQACAQAALALQSAS